MSESGWTPGAAEPPTEREDVRPLSHHDPDAHAEGASRPEPAGQDGAAAHVETETESEAKARARSFFAPRGPASAARLNREARFGIAALLSFLILVTVLIVNKGKSHARGEKIPSVAKTDDPQAPPARAAPAPSRAETESPRPGPGPKGTEHAGAPRRAGLPPAPAPIPPPPVMPQPTPLVNLGAKPAAGPDEPLHLPEGQDDPVPAPDATAPDKAVPVVAQPAAVPPSEGSTGPKPERTEGPKSEGAPSPAPQPLPMPLAPAEAMATPMLPLQANSPAPGRTPLNPAPTPEPAAPNPVPAPTPPAPGAAQSPAPAEPSSSAPGSNPPAPTPAAESLASTAGAPEAEKLARPEEGPGKPEERPSELPSPRPPSQPTGPKEKGNEKSADSPPPAPRNEPVVPKERTNEQPSPPPERPSEPVAPKEEEAPSTGPPPAADAPETSPAPTPQPKPEEMDRSLIVPNSSSFSPEPPPRAGGTPASAPTPRAPRPPHELATSARAPSPARSEETTDVARPAAAPDPSGGKPVAADATAGLAVATGAAIPNAGKRRALVSDPATRDVNDDAPLARPAPAASDDPDQVESVPHVVQSGENFWTISRLYYGSGRYYLALWKANSRLVPAPERLRVGMTIRIPPPEALDRSLIQPPRSMPATGSDSGSGKIYRRTSRPVLQEDRQAPNAPRRPSEIELALPVADPFSEPESEAPAVSDPDAVPETRFPPRRPIYKVRNHETLRSIARDTLGDSRRSGEILELNRDIIDDPNVLTEGQIIELPDDARIGHRSR